MGAQCDKLAVDCHNLCQLSPTNDSRQFVAPSVHICQTKLITCCDESIQNWLVTYTQHFSVTSLTHNIIRPHKTRDINSMLSNDTNTHSCSSSSGSPVVMGHTWLTVVDHTWLVRLTKTASRKTYISQL